MPRARWSELDTAVFKEQLSRSDDIPRYRCDQCVVLFSEQKTTARLLSEEWWNKVDRIEIRLE